MTNFSELIGKTIQKIDIKSDGDEISFILDSGAVYLMTHYANCCETVSIKDIDGDLDDLLNSPVLQAEEASSDDNNDYESWTFYRIHTAKGTVVISWEGSSNGYYSMVVSFEKIK